jgi:RNA polymerase sigma-70 factor, ECF subfamily
MQTDRPADAGANLEADLRSLCEAGRHDLAVTRAIEAFGGEIVGFLRSRLGEADAWEVFSMFSEDLWRGIPGFAWRCTLRAWVYTLARHAEIRFATAADRRPERRLTLSETPLLEAAVSALRTRSRTEPYQRTEVKNRFRALRARLPDEDQIILMLRVDRGLGWSEIVEVLAGPEAPPAPDGARAREEARVRKRFQLVKQRLRSWAKQEGLLDGTEGPSA